MSSSAVFPFEILDLIVDHLRAERIALKACCTVSKSWVPRTRKHLFTHVRFDREFGSLLDRWVRHFPDPSASPTHYTRSLELYGFPTIADVNCMLAHIRSFCNIVKLKVDTTCRFDNQVTLVPLHGVSPTLKSLSLEYRVLRISEVLNLICSFPLLEDLTLIHCRYDVTLEEYDIPSTSPKLTGTLTLDNNHLPMTRALTSLPNGLRFSKITMLQPAHHAESTLELVSKCSDTLDTLSMWYSSWDKSIVPPAFDLSKYSKLRDVRFHTGSVSIRWIIMTLEASKPESLRRVAINVCEMPSDETGEATQEWRDLDRLLSTLWASHSISPVVTCWYILKALVQRLLPELTNGGAVSYHW